MKKTVSIIVFYGALWGALEASLGYLLQFPFVPHFLSGLVMFPIALTLLVSAYTKVQSYKAMLAIGVIAASIKALNFLSPMHYWRTVNPMVAIILETLIVVAVVAVIVRKPMPQKIVAITSASVAWRLLYMAYMGGQFLTTGFVHEHLASPILFLEFVVVQGIFSAGLAVMVYYSYQFIVQRVRGFVYIQPSTATAMVVLAIVLTVLL